MRTGSFLNSLTKYQRWVPILVSLHWSKNFKKLTKQPGCSYKRIWFLFFLCFTVVTSTPTFRNLHLLHLLRAFNVAFHRNNLLFVLIFHRFTYYWIKLCHSVTSTSTTGINRFGNTPSCLLVNTLLNLWEQKPMGELESSYNLEPLRNPSIGPYITQREQRAQDSLVGW